MAEAAKDKKNVTLIDWYSRSKGHTEYFAPDGIHLENDGVEALTDEILKSIKRNNILIKEEELYSFRIEFFLFLLDYHNKMKNMSN